MPEKSKIWLFNEVQSKEQFLIISAKEKEAEKEAMFAQLILALIISFIFSFRF